MQEEDVLSVRLEERGWDVHIAVCQRAGSGEFRVGVGGTGGRHRGYEEEGEEE